MSDEKHTYLQGQIERVTFFSEESNYTVAKVKVYGRRDLVTVIGNLVNPTPGEVVKMTGEWGNHPKFGEQFKFIFCQTTTPATVHGIEKYLGSGLVKGIGPVMAKRIVKLFKEETLEVIEKDIEKLSAVEGIGKKRISMIQKAWAEQKEIREVMLFLQSHGVSSGYGAKIYKQYGNDAIKVVQENPYRLATDIFGIGFITADEIAEKLGLPRDSQLRAGAGILYVLQQLTDEGHVYYPYQPLTEKCREMLEIDREIIIRAFGTLAEEQQIVIEDLNQDLQDFQENHKAVYLSGYYRAETNLAARLKRLLHTSPSIRAIEPGKAIAWVQGEAFNHSG